MKIIRPARLRQILWKRLTLGPRWWIPRYKFGTAYRILNDAWVLNLRESFTRERAIELDIIESQLNNGFSNE